MRPAIERINAPALQPLANRAWIGLAAVFLLHADSIYAFSVSAHAFSHRGRAGHRPCSSSMGLALPLHGITQFCVRTLARSRQHRLISVSIWNRFGLHQPDPERSRSSATAASYSWREEICVSGVQYPRYGTCHYWHTGRVRDTVRFESELDLSGGRRPQWSRKSCCNPWRPVPRGGGARLAMDCHGDSDALAFAETPGTWRYWLWLE